MKLNGKHIPKRSPHYRKLRRFMRRHFFNKRAAEGSITIFLIIIMLPMLIFSCSVVDLCKIFMAKNSTEGALELAMNSRLASYDDILKDMYGIMASSANEDELAENLAAYYKMTLESSTGSVLSKDDKAYVENFFAELLKTDMAELNKEISDTNGYLYLFENEKAKLSVTPVATSSASNPTVMHKQIVEYMKYRGPVYLATGALDKIMAFSDVANQANAAKAQIDYERQLNSVGNDFKKLYEDLNIFLNQSDAFENNRSFAEFYKSGIVPSKTVRDPMSRSVAAAYVISFFGTAFDKYGNLSYTDDVKDAFDSEYTESKENTEATENLSEELKKLSGIKKDAEDAYKIFNTTNTASDFIKNNAKTNAVNFLNNRFGALFKNVSKTGSSDVLSLLKAYNEARKYYNYLDKEIGEEKKKNPIGDDLKTLESEMNTLKPELEKAKDVVGKIKSAADAIKAFMQRQYVVANANLGDGVDKLKDDYNRTVSQIDLLNSILTNIDKVAEGLTKAGEKASDYKTAINGVKTDSEKSNMMEVYNSDAAKIKDITLDEKAKEDLKDILQKLKAIYEAEKNSVESVQFLKTSGTENKVFETGLFNSVKFKSDLNVFLKNFCNAHKDESVNAWYDYSKYNDSDYFAYVTGSGDNIEKWNKFNGDIKNNEFYQTIVKYGKEKETADPDAKKKAEEAKKNIDDTGKSVGGKNDINKAGSENTDVDNSGAYKFVPQYYPTYNGYVQDLFAAYSADKNGDAKLKLLDEVSFSYEKSDDKKDDLPINGTSVDGDNDKISEGAANVLESIGTFFVDLLTATRDKFYIAEYLTENFPCFTTLQEDKESAQMISGVKFYEDNKPNIVCAHSSLEYILYGDIDGGEAEAGLSVAKASAVVFGVRFALNLIYALTSTQLALEIEPIIAPLEAIPFAGPIARTVILIGLALGESAIDIGLLLAGQEVALFKSDATWICSPSGFLKAAGETALNLVIDKGSELAKRALVEAEDELANKLAEGVDKAEAEVNKYTEEMLNSIRSEIENDVWTPIITIIRSCIDDYDPTGGYVISREEVEEKLNIALENVRINFGLDEQFNSKDSEDIVNKIKAGIFKGISDNKKEIIDAICDSTNLKSFYDAAKTGIKDGVDALDKKVKETFISIEEKIKTEFEKMTGELSGKIKEGITEVADELKKTTSETVDKVASDAKSNIKSKLNSSVNGKLKGTKSASKGVDLKKDSPSDSKDGLLSDKKDKGKKTDKTLNVSYKDYLYVFTVLGLILNEDNMLMRASQLMSANIEYRAFDSTRTERPNAYNLPEGYYDLNNAYTLFKGEAGSKTRTMFFGTTWNKENQQWVHPASNVYSYKAETYVGY